MAPDRKQPHRGKKGPRPPIPFDRFLAEAEQLRAKAIEMLRQDGYHTPICILFTDAGKEVVRLQLTGDRSMHEIVRAVVQVRQARAFVCISESWMVTGPGATEGIRPSQHPERRQVLTVSAIHPEGKTLWVYPFASEGGRVVIGPPLDTTGMTFGGGIPEALGGVEGER